MSPIQFEHILVSEWLCSPAPHFNWAKTLVWNHPAFQISTKFTNSVAQVGSKYILFGGADPVQAHFNDVHCFDSNTGKWEEVRYKSTLDHDDLQDAT